MQEACSNCCTNPFSGLQDSKKKNSSSTIANHPETEFLAAIVSSIQSNPNPAFTNHESLPPFQEMFSNLLKAYPLYPNFDLADQIRSHEYYHIAQTNHVYLDYIGHGLFSYAQKECNGVASTSCPSPPPPPQSQVVCSQVPFFDISHKAASLSSLLRHDAKRSDFEMVVKERVMKSMNISEDEYSMVFTANQMSSFRLLGISYPFQSNGKLITVYDYKNEAVEAMAESAVRKGAMAMTAEFSWPSMRINSKELRKMIMQKGRKKKGLFVFPLQSRMTGARYSYQWMNLAQENGWHVLLDADALLDKEMETLGLTLFRPDFVVSSFYKVFGENPSGFSCLFVKKSIISELNKTSKTLGIVSLVPTFQSSSKKSSISDAESSQEETLETMLLKEEELSFSTILEENRPKMIEFKGLDHADELGLVLISSRVRCHVNWLVNALLCLRHPHSENGALLVKIYGPSICFNRGPYVGFNIFDWKGEKVDPFLVQKLADRSEISLGCGILQNFWFKERYNKEEKERILEREKAEGVKCECGISVITVSIGFLNDFKDLYRVWAFVSRFLDADFVEKERWRYQAINQTTIEV